MYLPLPFSCIVLFEDENAQCFSPMKDKIYQKIIAESPTGYLYLKVIEYEPGVPCNYELFDANPAFEKAVGVKGGNIIGEKITDVMPEINECHSQWMECCARVVSKGESESFIHFFERSGRWFKVNISAAERGFLIVSLTDITEEKTRIADLHKMAVFSEEFLQGKDIDYHKIANDFLELSGAKYAAFNLYDEDGRYYYTMSIAGDKGVIKKAMNIMRMDLFGKQWTHDPVRAGKIKDNLITRFSDLHDLSGDVIPKPVTTLLQKSFGLGETVLVKIMKNDLMLGDFTFMMPKNKSFRNDDIVKIYTRQLGQLITKKRADDKLEKSEARFQKMLSIVPDLVSIQDTDMNIVYSNWNGMGNVAEHKKVLHSKCYKTYRGYDGICPDCEAIKVIQSKKNYYNAEIKMPDGSWIDLRILPVTNNEDNVEYFVEWVRDITQRKQAEQKIQYLNYSDQLTGLYNRRYYEAELERLDTERNLPLSLIIIDVNGLKLTNDAFGHIMGDKILKKVAGIVKNECRSDEIVARIGGDEFVVLLPKTSVAETEKIGERIRKAVDDENVGAVSLSVSMGWDAKELSDENFDGIFKSAEDAMYHNKLSESASMKYKTVDMILETLHREHPGEKLHSERVSRLNSKVGAALHLSCRIIENLEILGLLHDIGKVAISKDILEKPFILEEKERQFIQRHTEVGYQILNSVNEYSHIASYVLSHHERWDGKGYPKGLKGENIPLEARILSVAEAYDALTNERTYRKKKSHEEALEVLSKNAGTQFDPHIVSVFKDAIREEIACISDSHQV